MTDGAPLEAGERLVQPALAAPLDQLAHAGLDDFYRGDAAREVAADLDRAGSPVTREDLKRYQARLREPSQPGDRRRHFFNLPPPTQGLSPR